MEQVFGARRCRDTRKPRAEQCPDVVFYRCDTCGALFPVTGAEKAEGLCISCCGTPARKLVPKTPEEVKETIEVSYQITGGYNDNAVRVSWKRKSYGSHPDWIYLKTFAGGYLKYVSDGKRSPVVFARADTDAFCYCDEDPCLECVFRCKRGFTVYIYDAEAGLVELPLDKMTAHWQSGGKEPE